MTPTMTPHGIGSLGVRRVGRWTGGPLPGMVTVVDYSSTHQPGMPMEDSLMQPTPIKRHESSKSKSERESGKSKDGERGQPALGHSGGAKPGPKPGDRGYRRAPVLDRLWTKTQVTSSGCWEHSGVRTKKGYVRIAIGSRIDGTNRSEYIHIIAWEELVGPRDRSLTIDHLCENKACWNPLHLEQVTNAENKKRGGDRMTHCRRGHVRNEVNTYTRPDGKRQCRVCKRR